MNTNICQSYTEVTLRAGVMRLSISTQQSTEVYIWLLLECLVSGSSISSLLLVKYLPK